jgi:hypothetical protein
MKLQNIITTGKWSKDDDVSHSVWLNKSIIEKKEEFKAATR